MAWHSDGNGDHHRGRDGQNTLEFNPGPPSKSRKKKSQGAIPGLHRVPSDRSAEAKNRRARARAKGVR
jgi:hypothetical protein